VRVNEKTRERAGFFARLKEGLSRSSRTLADGISDIFSKRPIDAETLAALEELLIRADLGASLAAKITARLGEGRYDATIAPQAVRAILAEEIAAVLVPVERAFTIDKAHRPFVILVVGVNGSGKTTTIAKLAQRFKGQGFNVVLAAGDTFRAAAIEQLKIWGERVGVPVVAKEAGADAAGVAFEALEAAKAADVVIIDTAGRLHTKANLMAELQKIVRVLRKRDASAPHSVLLVLDATTGQNALQQVSAFKSIADVSGLVMTKLDGTAKGGILVAIAERYGLPVHFIGVGEGADDLQPFDARAFARALTGADD
jgi:fused signal recognition particle receptor